MDKQIIKNIIIEKQIAIPTTNWFTEISFSATSPIIFVGIR